MAGPSQLILGEHQRRLDDRYRLSIPSEMSELLASDAGDCILAKERPGCISLWSAPTWQTKLDEGAIERRAASVTEQQASLRRQNVPPQNPRPAARTRPAAVWRPGGPTASEQSRGPGI